jgi:hypothetical protein
MPNAPLSYRSLLLFFGFLAGVLYLSGYVHVPYIRSFLFLDVKVFLKKNYIFSFLFQINFQNESLILAFTGFFKNLAHDALEGLAVVVNRVTCSAPVPGSTLYVHVCHLRGALPAPGLAGCPAGRGE